MTGIFVLIRMAVRTPPAYRKYMQMLNKYSHRAVKALDLRATYVSGELSVGTPFRRGVALDDGFFRLNHDDIFAVVLLTQKHSDGF